MPAGERRDWALIQPPIKPAGRNAEMLNCMCVSMDLEKNIFKILVCNIGTWCYVTFAGFPLLGEPQGSNVVSALCVVM